MAAGCNGSRHGAPLPGLDHAPEHVHVEALAGHQLAQESNLTQGPLVLPLKSWHPGGVASGSTAELMTVTCEGRLILDSIRAAAGETHSEGRVWRVAGGTT